MFQGIPIIGVAGGIGGGKSHVAKLFGELGCVVIDSDAQVTAAYALPAVRQTLRQWWGPEVIAADGTIDRKRIARQVFSDPASRDTLEKLIHPVVAQLRADAMARAAAGDPRPPAFVWDSPLLFETGLYNTCDAVVFVDAPRAERVRRVAETRGWDDAELARREKSQWPLDNKRALSHYVLTNTARASARPAGRQADPPPAETDRRRVDPADPLREQVRLTLTRILESTSPLNRPLEAGDRDA